MSVPFLRIISQRQETETPFDFQNVHYNGFKYLDTLLDWEKHLCEGRRATLLPHRATYGTSSFSPTAD